MRCVAREDIAARQCGSNVFANNSSCNYQQHNNNNKNNNNSAASMHRRLPQHNRFSCSRSHALPLPLPSTWSLPPQLPVLLLLLIAVAISKMPITACMELAMESPVTTIANANANTNTSNVAQFLTVNKIISPKSGQDEDNEILTVVGDRQEVITSPEIINSKFEYPETSLTENLEETIRNSVKNEIEIEQNVDATSQQLFKDISEVEVRQALSGKMLAIEFSQKSADEKSTANATIVKESGVSPNDFKAPAQAAIESIDSTLKMVHESANHAHALEHNISNITTTRGARNVINDQLKELEPTASIPSGNESENVGFQSIEEERSDENVGGNKSAMSFPSVSSSSSSASSESKGNSDSQQSGEAGDSAIAIAVADEEPESLENSIEDVGKVTDAENTIVENDNVVDTSALHDGITPVSIDPQQVTAVAAQQAITEYDGALSIVLTENLTSTKPTPALEDDEPEIGAQLEEILNEAHVAETTTSPDLNKTVHKVIKKQGVDLNEAPIVGVDEFAETTTVWPETNEYSTAVANSPQEADDNQKMEKEEEEEAGEVEVEVDVSDENKSTIGEYEIETTVKPEVETVTSVTLEMENKTEKQAEDDSFVHFNISTTPEQHTTFPFEESTVNPTTEQQLVTQFTNKETDANAETEATESTTDLNNEDTTSAYEDDEYPDQDIAPATAVGSDATSSTKGSRSINTQTIFETFTPHVADQTYNDNLAAESGGGIGKALPARSVSEASFMSRSSIIIVVCSSMALLFLMASVVFFLVSFQRQHGTLDIEMQEQRCGKDDLDDEDEDANTCTKLLEIELPKSSVNIMTANETDECL